MADNGREVSSAAPDADEPSIWRSVRPWLAVAAFVLVAAAAVVYLLDWNASPEAPKGPPPGPLQGELIVALRPPAHAFPMRTVDQPGAVPVREGHVMSVEASLNQPAHMYLLWIDSRGQVVPLYPWNMEEVVKVKDADEPPEECRPGVHVRSPMILGKTWQFDKTRGMETVLLLVRRTPLPADTRVASLLGKMPPPKLREPEEVAVLGLDRGAKALTSIVAMHRGDAAEADRADEPLRQAMLRLQAHFELIRVARFAHDGD